MSEENKLRPIRASVLFELHDNNIISDEEFAKYFRKDGKLSIDANLIKDLACAIPISLRSWCSGGHPLPPAVIDTEKAEDFVLELRCRGFVKDSEVREYFGL